VRERGIPKRGDKVRYLGILTICDRVVQMLRFLTHGIARVLLDLIRSKHPGPIDDLVERRREILASLRARDADAAKKQLTNHLMHVHARMEEVEAGIWHVRASTS
jgi:DNA-binding GntR family transcriptional regulator